MKTISHSIEINAPAADVWKVLTDLAAYPDWNPFIREASGRIAVGERLTLRMFPANGKPMTFRPRVLAADPGAELRWIGRFILPGVFDGEHRFTLTETATGGTELVQSENFSGLLVPFTGKTIAATRQNFAALNQALKTRAENPAQPNPAAEPISAVPREAACDRGVCLADVICSTSMPASISILATATQSSYASSGWEPISARISSRSVRTTCSPSRTTVTA